MVSYADIHVRNGSFKIPTFPADESFIAEKNIYQTQLAMINWDNTKKEVKQTFGYPVKIGVFE